MQGNKYVHGLLPSVVMAAIDNQNDCCHSSVATNGSFCHRKEILTISTMAFPLQLIILEIKGQIISIYVLVNKSPAN